MNDYISREAAKRVVLHLPTTPDEKIIFLKKLNTVSAADVRAVVRGEWGIDYIDTDYPYECSNCHGVSKDRWSYCPFCGADMRGTDNG